MKRIGIIYHPKNEAAIKQAEHVKEWCEFRGIGVWTMSAWDVAEYEKEMDYTDFVVTAGGDGTVLRAAQVACKYTVPLLGINHGTLGFLTEVQPENVDAALDQLLTYNYRTDERHLIEVDVTQPGKEMETYHALNDIVIARSEMARLVGLNTEINGQKLTYFKADGLVCCTSTGSTGYAYACGGAVMYPSSTDIQLVAISPHLTFDHSVILPQDSEIKVTLFAGYNGTMNIDGHINIPVVDKSEFVIRKSALTVNFIRLHDDKFYETLTTKLRTRL